MGPWFVHLMLSCSSTFFPILKSFEITCKFSNNNITFVPHQGLLSYQNVHLSWHINYSKTLTFLLSSSFGILTTSTLIFFFFHYFHVELISNTSLWPPPPQPLPGKNMNNERHTKWCGQYFFTGSTSALLSYYKQNKIIHHQ